MERVEKTVFISYRRTNFPWGFSIYQYLTHRGYDVFFDYKGIASGDFERVILENITARAHFLVLLTPSALERCGDSADWLRREIEAALDAQRNMVPLMLDGFDFGTPSIAGQLTGKLAALKSYNALSMPPEYFEEAMANLVDRYLNVSLDAVLHPASATAQRVATEQKTAAEKARVVLKEELAEQQSFERLFSTADFDEKLRFYSLISSGNERSARGDVEGALEDYSEAIRLNPDHAVAFYNRGDIRRVKGDAKGALQDLGEAIRLKPDYSDAFLRRGNVHRLNGDLMSAIKDYSEAIRLKAENAFAFNNRGSALREKGDMEGALQDFSEAIRLKPNLAEAFLNRSNARKAKGDVEGALQDFREAIRLGYKPN